MVETRRYHLEILSAGVSRVEGTYGAGVYGSPDTSYGRKEGESVLTAEEYRMLPIPGWAPSRIGWIFRQNDTGKPFGCVLVDIYDSSNKLDLSTLASAELVMHRADIKAGTQVIRYPLVLDVAAGTLTRAWQTGDLAEAGVYNAYVQLVFNTGRRLTIDTGEGPYIEVKS